MELADAYEIAKSLIRNRSCALSFVKKHIGKENKCIKHKKKEIN